MPTALHAAQAGQAAPPRDEGPTVAAAGPQGNKQDESPDSDRTRLTGQALRVIEGERKAQEYLARLRAEQANVDELALVVAPLYGAELRGFCAVLTKCLRSEHHA